jgi:hypothetical protein
VNHNWFLGNLDPYELGQYQAAIASTRLDMSIRKGAYDYRLQVWDPAGYSLWCDADEGDLSRFWALVEGE